MNERIRLLAEQAFFDENTNQPSDKMYTFSEHKMQQFADMIVADLFADDVKFDMSNPAYARAMDEYYENKWAHRFD
jgi:hypothetical protein